MTTELITGEEAWRLTQKARGTGHTSAAEERDLRANILDQLEYVNGYRRVDIVLPEAFTAIRVSAKMGRTWSQYTPRSEVSPLSPDWIKKVAWLAGLTQGLKCRLGGLGFDVTVEELPVYDRGHVRFPTNITWG